MRILTYITLTLITLPLLAKVAAPNYQFTLEKLQAVLPGTEKATVDGLLGKSTLFQKNGPILTYQFKDSLYSFPVLVKYQNEKVSDLYIKFPSYFLHDVLHKNLISKLGKQDQYIRGTRNALFIWKSKNGLRYIYSGSCTITCFPEFLSITAEAEIDQSILKILDITPMIAPLEKNP